MVSQYHNLVIYKYPGVKKILEYITRTFIITVMKGYDKGPVGQGITNRGNYIPGVLAGLVELAASIPNITSINARRACKTRREHNEYYNQKGNPLVCK